LSNLLATTELLRQGVEIKPGRLFVLKRLCQEESVCHDFLRFLLGEVSRDLPDVPVVQGYFSEVNGLMNVEHGAAVDLNRLKFIAQELRALQPMRKSISAHARRRRVEYVDLYLLENVVNGLTAVKQGWWPYYSYEAAKLFIFNCDDMRYRVGDKTLSRWNTIVAYWHEFAARCYKQIGG
jgi:hypothetical protein